MSKTICVRNQSQLGDAAEHIIESLGDRSIVLFHGEMGAGKTTLIREIAARLGVEQSVTSPTFALVNEYKTVQGRRIFHFDFYRIDRPEEAFDFGYEEYISSGELCLIEWPEKVAELLPDGVMNVRIDVVDRNQREITID